MVLRVIDCASPATAVVFEKTIKKLFPKSGLLVPGFKAESFDYKYLEDFNVLVEDFDFESTEYSFDVRRDFILKHRMSKRLGSRAEDLDMEIVNLIVGSTKDHKKVYKAVEKFYTIRNECMKAGISFEELVDRVKTGL